MRSGTRFGGANGWANRQGISRSLQTNAKFGFANQTNVLMDFGLQAGLSNRPERGDEILSVKYTAIADSTVGDVMTNIHFALQDLDGVWNDSPAGGISPWTQYPGELGLPVNDCDIIITNTLATDILTNSNATGTDNAILYALQGSSSTSGLHAEIGQTVTIPNSPGTLSSIQMRLKRYLSPAGSVRLKIFDVAADDGSNDRPVGDPLAVSDDFTASSLPTATTSFTTFNFSGVNQIDLAPFANTRLCVVVDSDHEVSSTNAIAVKIDSTNSLTDGSAQIRGNVAQGTIGQASYFADIDFPWLRKTTDGTGANFGNHGTVSTVTFPTTTASQAFTVDLPTTQFQEWVNDSRYPFDGMDKIHLSFSPEIGLTTGSNRFWGNFDKAGDILEVVWRSKNRVFIT
jgi:hypothetical protein